MKHRTHRDPLLEDDERLLASFDYQGGTPRDGYLLIENEGVTDYDNPATRLLELVHVGTGDSVMLDDRATRWLFAELARHPFTRHVMGGGRRLADGRPVDLALQDAHAELDRLRNLLQPAVTLMEHLTAGGEPGPEVRDLARRWLDKVAEVRRGQ